jgi:diaminohydroxyphosphoribosylaminopyrimidine deaminase / 5-amino-6-(5-phosphoribosylamino)uracil reductase
VPRQRERIGAVDERTAWRWLLSLTRPRAGTPPAPTHGTTTPTPADLFPPATASDERARRLLELYLPLCRGTPARFVVAHLGQSLDGRIAVANGGSHWVTGQQDIVHNHRMRALFDAVVVGAGTVRHDDPQLTVRAVPGPHPLRVVLDTGRRLGPDYRVFTDGEAPSLLFCAEDLAGSADRVGQAEVVGIPTLNGSLCLSAVLERLAGRGLGRVFVEGGGITVSRFLAAGCLHRLQITIAPVIIGSGRPSITLPEVERVSAALRPEIRRVALGDDLLFECRLNG